MVIDLVECTYEEPDPSTCTACDVELTGNVLTSNPEGRISECTDIPTHTCGQMVLGL